MTYAQCQKLGGNVLQGAKSSPILKWTPLAPGKDAEETVDVEGESIQSRKGFLRVYRVFNVAEQTEGLELPTVPVRVPVSDFCVLRKLAKRSSDHVGTGAG